MQLIIHVFTVCSLVIVVPRSGKSRLCNTYLCIKVLYSFYVQKILLACCKIMLLFEVLESSFCAMFALEIVLCIEVNEFGCITDLINVLSDLE